MGNVVKQLRTMFSRTHATKRNAAIAIVGRLTNNKLFLFTTYNLKRFGCVYKIVVGQRPTTAKERTTLMHISSFNLFR